MEALGGSVCRKAVWGEPELHQRAVAARPTIIVVSNGCKILVVLTCTHQLYNEYTAV